MAGGAAARPMEDRRCCSSSVQRHTPCCVCVCQDHLTQRGAALIHRFSLPLVHTLDIVNRACLAGLQAAIYMHRVPAVYR